MERKHQVLILLGIVALTGSLLVQSLWIYSGYRQSERNLQEALQSALEESVDDLNTWQELSIIADYSSDRDEATKGAKHEVHFIQSSEVVLEDIQSDSMVRRVVIKGGDTQTIDDKGSAVIRMEYRSDSNVESNTKIEWFSDSLVDEVLAIREDGRLADVVQKIELEHVRTSQNWKERIDFNSLQEKVNENLNDLAKTLEVQLAIVDSSGNPIDSFMSDGFEIQQSKASAELFPSDLKKKDIYFEAHYTDLFSAALRNMWLLIFGSAIFSVLMIAVFIIVIRRMISNSRLSQLKSDFINNMSHELKTPLATIALASDALKLPEVVSDKERSAEFITKIQEEHDRILGHVERVLQVAQSESGSLEFNLESVELNGLINAAVEAFKIHVQSKGGSIDVDLSESTLIDLDAGQFRSALDNLIDNAIKYGGEPPQVRVQTEQSASHITITISDNGAGLSSEEAERAFDRFHRGDTGNLHTVKGFGLGLSYVKTIVEGHNGEVFLRPGNSGGAEAIIRLPTT